MTDGDRVSMRWPEPRLAEIDQLVDRGLFQSRSEAIRALAERSLDEAKADGPIEVVVRREDGRNYAGQSDEDHRRNILNLIDGNGGSFPQASLHHELEVSRAKVSQLLADMESDGVVERRPRPSDSRGKLVERGTDDLGPEEWTFYATRIAGRSNGVLHTSRTCPHIVSLPDEDIIDGKREAFDPDQPVCKICQRVVS